MPIPGGGSSPDDLGLGNISNTPGGTGDVARLKLLELLQLQSQGKRNTNASVIGDVLKTQTDRKTALADSYAEGTQYAPGFEPAGVFDAMSAFSKQMGGPGFQIDPKAREINPQHIEDMGSSIADALSIMKQITDANGEDNSVQNALMAALSEQLIPKAVAGDSKINTNRSGMTGDTDSGTGGTAATSGKQSIKPPLGKAGEPKGGGQVGGTDRRTLSSDLGSVLDSIGGGADATGGAISGGIKGLTDYLGLTGGGGGAKTPGVATGDLNADATAAMVAQIMQRASGAAPVAGSGRKDWGASTPGSKHPTGYKDGSQVFEGPTMIRVGERSHKDKKYATEEVVYAAPGTVVAPVPKGMENPSEEDAAGLLIAQILKSKNSEPDIGAGMKESATGSLTSSATNGRNLAGQLGLGLVTQQSSNKNQHLDRLQRDTQMRINERQGNRSLDLQGRGQDQNYDLGLRNWMTNNQSARDNSQLGRDRLSLDSELGRGQLDVARQNLNLNFEAHQDEVRNWEAERALKRELGMRGLDIDKQRADQSYAIDSAQMAFQQIMAGITGSALPGVRAGRTPQLSLLG